MKNILVTGAAGFIGFHFCQRLLAQGFKVLGVDNLNAYYDPKLKEDRLRLLKSHHNFHFKVLDILDFESLRAFSVAQGIAVIVHLAAQAGVRYSLTHPEEYIKSNVQGFFNILELAKFLKVEHLIYASSSSIYGQNTKVPFSIHDQTDKPVSLYAATKKSNELMAHTYHHLYQIPMTGLRFFTVYGPWGRPDMAYFSFTEKILKGEPIAVFNKGELARDFTYIDDIVEGLWKSVEKPPRQGFGQGLYRIFNLGNNQPVRLMDFIGILENVIGKKALLDLKPMQPGDVLVTYADIKESQDEIGYEPKISLQKGLENFYQWYDDYFRLEKK